MTQKLIGTNLIPMAGKGQRFADAGYTQSKPLIEISGEPMISKVVKSLPEAERWCFVCREEHLSKDRIDEMIKQEGIAEEPDFINFIVIEKDTEGQACTCLLAEKHMSKAQRSKPVFISACDNLCVWDKKKFYALIKEHDPDIVVWSFRNQNNVLIRPAAYAWIKVKDDGKTIELVSVKKPLSTDIEGLLKDHALVGSFYFKSADLLFSVIRELISKNMRINNEFYVDNAINTAISMGCKAVVFPVDKFICFGTPRELEEYVFWEEYFLGERN